MTDKQPDALALAAAVPAAMRVVTDAMRSDPEYAWSWHCNVAMAFVDEGGDHAMANHAAARFMRLLANVEPAHELPPKQAQQPASDFPKICQTISDLAAAAVWGEKT